MQITIGNKEYEVREAKTPEEKEKGLQRVDQLPDNEGMLFYYDPPEEEISFWMKETPIALDIIFINEDQEVISVKKGEPNSEKPIRESDVAYVLEVNQDSGIKKGDILELEDEGPVMSILAPDGSSQMELWGGERIFRRAFTKQLIRWAKKAYSVKDNEEQYNKICKTIGKKMFKELKAQDERPPEYVSAPQQ